MAQKFIEEELQKENANLAFELMITQGKVDQATQENADLTFQLMVNGVL